jgi:hypothetical protein
MNRRGVKGDAKPLGRVPAFRNVRLLQAIGNRTIGRPPARTAASLVKVALDDIDHVQSRICKTSSAPFVDLTSNPSRHSLAHIIGAPFIAFNFSSDDTILARAGLYSAVIMGLIYYVLVNHNSLF